MVAIFKGLIYCAKCGKKHKYKKRANKPVYVCSTYDNYGANKCSRNQVDEDRLIWLVSGHFKIEEDELTEDIIRKNIEKAIITPNRNKIEVYYNDGTYSVMSPCMLIR